MTVQTNLVSGPSSTIFFFFLLFVFMYLFVSLTFVICRLLVFHVAERASFISDDKNGNYKRFENEIPLAPRDCLQFYNMIVCF